MSAPFDHFQYEKDELCVDGVPLTKIAEQVGTPAYVYSAEALLEPLRLLQKGLSSIDHLVCFAVKSNSNLAVLKMLSDAGAGMDLVSGGELFRALRAGVPANKIVFSGVGKQADEMVTALSAGIFSFNVESAAELEQLQTVAAEAGVKASVALRFNPNVDAKTHPYISTGLKKNKFGIQRAEILRLAKSADRLTHIDWAGISIHIGSQLVSLSPLADAFALARELVDELNEILPEPLRFVDLGGGVGITYKNEKPPAIKKYCELVLKHFGPKAGLSHPLKVLIEPGRSIAGNAGVLLTEVLYRKENAKKHFVVVDAAMNDLMRPALYGSYHEIAPVSRKLSLGKKFKTDIVGPVCESSDCFAGDRPLSAKINSGDLLAVLSAGAYGFTMASNYNTRPRPPEVLVREGEYRVIRERETLEDLIRHERLP